MMQKLFATILATTFLPFALFAQVAGTLDADFNSNGKLTFSLSNQNDIATDITTDANDKIVIGGAITNANGDFDFSVVRLNPDGSFDTDFSGDGKASVSFGVSVFLSKIIVQPNGKILAGGFGDGKVTLARLNTNGTLDTDFSFDGKVTISAPSNLKALTIDKNGNIYAVGDNGFLDSVLVIIKYKPDGTLDQNFGIAGVKKTAIGFSVSPAQVFVTDNGSIYISGTIFSSSKNLIFSSRLTASGDADPTYGSSKGFRTITLPKSVSAAGAVLDPNGNVFVAGTTDGNICIAKFLSSGNVDLNFGTSGSVETKLGFSEHTVKGIALQPDGKLLVATKGFLSLQNIRFAVARFSNNGSPDNSFGTGGAASATFSPNPEVFALSLQKDGRLLIAGSIGATNQADHAIVRYLTGLVSNVASLQGNQTALQIHPTVTSSHIQIQTSAKDTPLYLFDINGKLINKIDAEELPQIINVSTLPSGMYFIKQGAITKRFIKE